MKEQVFRQFPEVEIAYKRKDSGSSEEAFWQDFFAYYVAKFGDGYFLGRMFFYQD